MAPHHRNLHRSILDAIAHPVGYALQHDAQGHGVGFGLAVLERGAVGLYDLAVAPEHRGGGRGRALVQALLHWGMAGRCNQRLPAGAGAEHACAAAV